MAGQLVDPRGSGQAGRFSWSMTRSREGHRDFTVQHLVRTDSPDDGPQIVFNTPGLPLTGNVWALGNDLDFWAICLPKLEVKVHQATPGNPHVYWLVTNHFSTKPLIRCQDEEIEDPLLIPQDISGSFVNRRELATRDKDGTAITSSSHERLSATELEFDHANPTVKIGQNVAALGLEVFSQMVNTVNDAPLWGMAARSVKLTNVGWERLVRGTCDFYYRRNFEFDIDFGTFDRTVNDRGRMELDPNGGGDKTNPADFRNILDTTSGNPIQDSVPLDGNGVRVVGPNALQTAGQINVQFYQESNFLLLGIPTTL